MYIDVKPVVTIVASMDLHAICMGEASIRGGLLLHIMGLLKKRGVYSRKNGMPGIF